MVVPRFVNQALRNEPITVYGDGTQSRCFTHVNDSVRAIVGLMDANHTTGEVYNVGSQNEITINGLADRVIEKTGSASRIVYVPFAVAYEENFEDMPRRVPCTTKIEKAIGWVPQVSLEGILDDVIAFSRDEGAIAIPSYQKPRAVRELQIPA